MGVDLSLYLNALFSDEDFDIGFISITGTDTPSSKYAVNVRRLIKAVLENSWEPEKFADKVMLQLAACTSLSSTVADLNRGALADPAGWVEKVKTQCTKPREELGEVRKIAQYYLTYLLVPLRNAGAMETPQSTEGSTPYEDINLDLISQATVQGRQNALKELLFRRDGIHCPITGVKLRGPNKSWPRCGHILPLSLHNKIFTHRAIEVFTNNKITRHHISKYINHPRNALNLEKNVHYSFQSMGCGIEAQPDENGTITYKYTVVDIKRVPRMLEDHLGVRDGNILPFGQALTLIDPPDPDFCNLKLAVARIAQASGAGDVMHAFDGDYEYFEDSDEVSDDFFGETLFMHLDQIAFDEAFFDNL